ncbi:MAG: LON peptidase substrate-binding domain-containing protein [Bacteroidota bacterium]|nr:LON peptidase substrate-binding domain-containing protein [Candidatus Kapabacteria bacterium]MCS7302415.1 LON peptidase substrate-binding domain-containing protein [Candidatus Kapabacteria bacterium]MCX7937111.1 LON peptidase substrate-binding domain-containing protein [Chlorobiota bacterium]MDW8074604.1 LON peptidase substrate-binding domain-containing protein [Bacteroidota bacterium]MDW8270920.1 LON peptidase substrate-binding domain-containing protein [Bacteroidota bacterium]
MATATQQIGLFPLNTVLFPGALLPLHIFEPRYRQLISECIESNAPFGINLLDEGNLHLVGCTAHVQGVLRHYEDGRFDIIIVGRRRYTLQSFDDESKPYLVGIIEYLDDYSGQHVDLHLYQQCVQLYNQLVRRVFPGLEQVLLPEENIPDFQETTPSFFMAQKAGLSLRQKQVVLSLQSENERLEFLRQHLTQLLPRLDQMEEVLRVARRDGYYPPQQSHR